MHTVYAIFCVSVDNAFLQRHAPGIVHYALFILLICSFMPQDISRGNRCQVEYESLLTHNCPNIPDQQAFVPTDRCTPSLSPEQAPIDTSAELRVASHASQLRATTRSS